MTALLDLGTPTAASVPRRRGADAGRTVVTLAGLLLALPVDLGLVAVALLSRRRNPLDHRTIGASKTVLLSGGKMTKALQLARSFHSAGHRVVLVESTIPVHRTQFSRAVDAFHCAPDRRRRNADALLDVARREGSTCSFRCQSRCERDDSRARRHSTASRWSTSGRTVQMLDDTRRSPVPQPLLACVCRLRRITDARQIAEFDFPEGRSYILKRIAYNPWVGWTSPGCRGRRRSETLRSHARCRSPRTTRGSCRSSSTARSSARTAPSDTGGCRCTAAASRRHSRSTTRTSTSPDPSWVKSCRRLRPHRSSLIRLHRGTGRPCVRHRVQSAHPFGDHHVLRPPAGGLGLPRRRTPRHHTSRGARATYWIYHELWRLLTQRTAGQDPDHPARQGRDLRVVDHLPYLMVHHLQIPSLLIGNLRNRRGWTRIDFNIGKLVEPGGD